MKNTSGISQNPIYNIKSVSEMTGIAPVTLRAWERRYGFPNPERTETGYRLYSEYEIAALNWLRMQTENGLSIGQAVKLLKGLISGGETPLAQYPSSAKIEKATHQSIEQINKAYVEALIVMDEEAANSVMRTAQNMYPIDTVMLEIFSPVMNTIGEMWHDGEISITTEHFATHHIRMQLMNALDATKSTAKRGTIIAGCAPKEWHEIGLLMLTVMLRWRGWSVTYLGANLSLEKMGETLERLKPDMILFSATKQEAAEELEGLVQVLDAFPDKKPIIGLGGLAFIENPTLTNRIPGTFLGANAKDAVNLIENMLSHIE